MSKKNVLNVGFEIKNISEDETDGGSLFVFEGYLSTFGNVDNGGDVIVKGAFAKSLQSRMPSLLWQHDMNEPIGVFKEVREDEIGLYVKGCLPRDDDFVAGRVIPQMKVGSVKTMSIGYYANDYEYDADGVRVLKEVTLLEGSLVTIPMNDMAKVSGFKSFLNQIDDLSDDEKKQLVEKIDNVKYTVDDVEEISTKTEFEKVLRKAGFSKGAAQCMANKKEMFMGRSKSDDGESDNSAVMSAITDLKSLLLERK